jgi:hypothetical protein
MATISRDASVCFESANFMAIDLQRQMEIPGNYDLAVCFEVAEHFPERPAPRLLASLTGAASVVMFSAAIPGKGGVEHVNEQWLGYWRSSFAEREYMMVDAPLNSRRQASSMVVPAKSDSIREPRMVKRSSDARAAG